jgi:hypothetical protein
MTTPPDDRNLGRILARAQKSIGIQVENVITTLHAIFSGPTEITNDENVHRYASTMYPFRQ